MAKFRWQRRHRLTMMVMYQHFKLNGDQAAAVFNQLFNKDLEACEKEGLTPELMKGQYGWRSQDRSTTDDGWPKVIEAYDTDHADKDRYVQRVKNTFRSLYDELPAVAKGQSTGKSTIEDTSMNKTPQIQQTPSKKRLAETVVVTPKMSPTKKARTSEDTSQTAATPKLISPDKYKRTTVVLLPYNGRLPQRLYRVFSSASQGQNSLTLGFLAGAFTHDDEEELPLAPRTVKQIQSDFEQSPYITVFSSLRSAIAYAEELDAEGIMISEIASERLDNRTDVLQAQAYHEEIKKLDLPDYDPSQATQQYLIFHHINAEAVIRTHNYVDLRSELEDDGVLDTMSHLSNTRGDVRAVKGTVAKAAAHLLVTQGLCDTDQLSLVAEALEDFVLGKAPTAVDGSLSASRAPGHPLPKAVERFEARERSLPKDCS